MKVVFGDTKIPIDLSMSDWQTIVYALGVAEGRGAISDSRRIVEWVNAVINSFIEINGVDSEEKI